MPSSCAAELPDGARAHALQLDRADGGAGQPGDRQPDVGQQPAHDVLAALVQHDLDHRLAGVGVDDAERVDLHRAVVELDAGPQPAVQVARHRARHLGEVGLAHLVGRVGQPVGQLAVGGEQQQALGVLVEPADVHQPLGQVADHVADGRPVAVVAHRGDDARRLVHRVGDAVVADLDADAVDGDLVGAPGRPACPGPARPAPFTLIRPASIMSSQTRREPTPARASTFCSRSPWRSSSACSGARSPGGRGRAPCPRTSRRRPRWWSRRLGVAVFIAAQSPTVGGVRSPTRPRLRSTRRTPAGARGTPSPAPQD